ncbi:MAG: NAD-dependent epimerase/dehydratase family protein [Sphingobacteriales bacterium]|nr:NAD-dependent epimerase/dehydratase family protein [Sphingobacteriales bacterium]OJY81097.1 MAG: 3-beta hydroxysteroid dehydrogenase [Sphingobacteriales bacterium 44-15]
MIFVTGGTGLLGSYLLRDLVARGEKVRALYRTVIPPAAWAKSVEWIQGDILDPGLLAESMRDVQQVYHCAAVVSFNPRKRREMMKVNVEGTANIVNTALENGKPRLLYVSSVSALGRKYNGEPVSEASKWEEEKYHSHYGRSKYFAEMEVWRAASEGLDAAIINPSLILGAGNWNDGSSAIFKKAWEEFPWYSEGGGGFVDVKDVVNAMTALMETDIAGERFIINAENWPFRKLFTQMAEAFGKRPPHKKAPPAIIALLWRLEKMRCFFSGSEPVITKETADTAQRMVIYDNTKLLKLLPGFCYTPVQQTIEAYCREYAAGNN